MALMYIKIASMNTNESENVNYSGWNEQFCLISWTIEKTPLCVHSVNKMQEGGDLLN